MRVVVTGGAGFIGSHLTERLLGDGHQVLCIDRLDSFYPVAVKLENLSKAATESRFELLVMDLGDSEQLTRVLNEFEPALVMHLAAPEGIEGSFRALHAPPSRIGDIAAASNARKLVLSHLTRWSLPDLEANLATIRERYDGEIVLAEDLMCITPPDPATGRAEPGDSN